jgi:predicted nucleic acid-binding protein
MKAVVDTNVIAYHLLGTPRFAAEAESVLGNAEEILAPSLWEAELANVIWMAARARVITAQEAPARLALAARLGVRSVPVRTLWHGALVRSLQSNVELAEREQVMLATFDRRLRRAFPRLARRPGELQR